MTRWLIPRPRTTGACVAKQIKDEDAGAAFGGAKGKPEDAELRSAGRVIQACGAVESTI